MVRKLTTIALAVSFLAMSTSGILMFIVEKPSFTIEMHPVHKLFGAIMIVAIIAHLYFNYRVLLNNMKNKSASIFGGVLVVLLVVAYGAVINTKIPDDLATQMDEAAAQYE